MLFWIILAFLTVGTAIALIRPLVTTAASTAPSSPPERGFYRAQIAGIERDVAAGLIDAGEAGAARAEIGRRLIASSSSDMIPAAGSPRLRRGVALGIAVFLPLAALSVYLSLGSPDAPDRPLSTRLAETPDRSNLADLVGRVERHLESQPDDIGGWRVLAPIYLRMGRYDDAIAAFERIVAAGKADADIREGYAEALVSAAGGVVGPKAQQLLAEVIAAAPDRASARFYYAEGLRQSGDLKGALAAFDELIRRSPADAPWLAMTRERRRAVLSALDLAADTPEPPTLPAVSPPAVPSASAAMPGPGEADVKAAAEMSAADRSAMIAGMVERLANRLAEAPDDAEGWKRLIRAYMVMGRPDDARAALAKARDHFKTDATTLSDLDAAGRQFGLD